MTQKRKIRNSYLLTIIILIIAIFILTYFWGYLTDFFSNSQNIRGFVTGFGMLAPLALIILVIFQIIVSPIPGATSGIVGGYIFGTFWGGFYVAIATVIGHMLAFALARRFGKSLVEKAVGAEKLKKFDKIVRSNTFILFLIYLLPGFPDDSISYIVGLTELKIKIMLLIATVGALGSFVTAFLGSSMAEYNTYLAVLMFIGIILVSLIVYKFKDDIDKMVLKLAYKWGKVKNGNKRG